MKPFSLICITSLFIFSSFSIQPSEDYPKTITRNITSENGNSIQRTVIELNGDTSREDIIQTCTFLAKEDVQLTFEKLEIGKSFFGLIGKSRIRLAEGKIQFSNGSYESFKAGGSLAFKFLKIQYSKNLKTGLYQIEMIEKIDSFGQY
jgi:hypothetical protein